MAYNISRLTIIPEHLTLLKNMWVGWCPDEFGAPEIDPKRPYGNSNVIEDMKELLGENIPDDVLNALHKETETALQICLQLQKFEVGTYERDDRYRWHKV